MTAGSNLFSEIIILLRTKNLTSILPIIVSILREPALDNFFSETVQASLGIVSSSVVSFILDMVQPSSGLILPFTVISRVCVGSGVCWKSSFSKIPCCPTLRYSLIVRSTTWATGLKALRRPFDLTYVEYDLTEYDV